MKAKPMVMPMMAMALVRCSSRVRSAASAMTAAATAPLPCSARPAITPQMLSDIAATTLPSGEQQQPRRDHRLAAEAVGQHAEGNLEHRLGQAVGAHGHAHQQGRHPDEPLRVQGEHRKDQKQSQHAQRHDGGQAGGCAALRVPVIALFMTSVLRLTRSNDVY